jgi:hypothetical protein
MYEDSDIIGISVSSLHAFMISPSRAFLQLPLVKFGNPFPVESHSGVKTNTDDSDAISGFVSSHFQLTGTAGATVARSPPERKVIRSNRVWFNTSLYNRIFFCFFLPFLLFFWPMKSPPFCAKIAFQVPQIRLQDSNILSSG